jgi:polysaccharide deacetylase family protein (PEP-CTERM system associated)
LRHPDLVRDIVTAGHEIGSHGHLHRRIFELTPEVFADDLAASRAALAAAGAEHVQGFRAPEWSINGRSMWALDVLARSGFAFDSSMAPMRIVGDPKFPQHPHTRTTSCGDVLEFPPLVGRRFGQNMPLGLGWGMRMSDPARIVDAIHDRNQQGIPVALAVHPWEIDPEPPRVKLPPAQRFAHYFRLEGFRARLERVLRGSTFAPMGDVLGLSSAVST